LRIKRIEVVLRKDGFFHLSDGRKIPAIRNGNGYGVMVFLESSPIDKDFSELVWVPSDKEAKDILRLMDESDKHTHKMLGHGWAGKRPFWMLQDFM